jgi:uncharacterized membrane protein YccC
MTSNTRPPTLIGRRIFLFVLFFGLDVVFLVLAAFGLAILSVGGASAGLTVFSGGLALCSMAFVWVPIWKGVFVKLVPSRALRYFIYVVMVVLFVGSVLAWGTIL